MRKEDKKEAARKAMNIISKIETCKTSSERLVYFTELAKLANGLFDKFSSLEKFAIFKFIKGKLKNLAS